jgi:hypothetical protein
MRKYVFDGFNHLNREKQTSSTRVFVIGLMQAPLIFSTLDQGRRLPNLKRMVEKSTSGRLESTIPPSPPAWTSFMTGVNPGKHGVFDFFTFPRALLRKFLSTRAMSGQRRSGICLERKAREVLSSMSR